MMRALLTGLAIVLAFAAGVAFDAWMRIGAPVPIEAGAAETSAVETTDAETSAEKTVAPVEPAAPKVADAAPTSVHEPVPEGTTGRSTLRVPIDGFEIDAMKGGFAEQRGGHPHEAVDLLAPRNTPVHAVEDGTVAKLFLSKAGGITLYEFDPGGRICYYYAHLERYADGLKEGDAIRQGQVIGYVGTSGNAPANTPHLHFAVFELGPERQWWKGKAVDPYLVFR